VKDIRMYAQDKVTSTVLCSVLILWCDTFFCLLWMQLVLCGIAMSILLCCDVNIWWCKLSKVIFLKLSS
jgi:hypothetical protein